MKKIVLIEDNNIVVSIYRNKLQSEGFKVEVAMDGEKGLKLVESYKPDLLLLDLMLPKLSGSDILKTLRAKAEFASLPVIVLSNAPLSSTLREAWQDGATQVMMKATQTPAHVIEAIREALAKRDALADAASVNLDASSLSNAPSDFNPTQQAGLKTSSD